MPTNDVFNLPIVPDELCFDKSEFIKKTFSVDEFLHEHRNAAGLEQMRDDLGIYLKVLRSAMIELINEDYVDFVNLSSNLIGLDQSINGIQVSLGQLKEEILTVKMTLTDTMSDLSQCLEEKLLLKNHLNSIRSVAKARLSIKKLDDLLCAKLQTDGFDAIILERAALELIQLKFDMQFCSALIEKSQGQDRLTELSQILMEKLENYFLNIISTNNSDSLERCLRIYAALDEHKIAEEIFRKNIVAPHMHGIISEASLQNCPNGLYGIYKQILDFIEASMKNLLTLTRHDGKIKGFDFALNSFWIEIETRLETHMTSIFAPGNPDMFYQKYKNTMEFLNQFERILCSETHAERWKNSVQYKNFQTKWNLPVYFQIRFQEIGGTLEKACSTPIDKQSIQPKDGFKLVPFSTAWTCISKCWLPGIYLQEIFIRFWTLTLQQISRIGLWIDECITIKKWPVNFDENEKIDLYVCVFIDTKELSGRLPNLLSNIFENISAPISSHKNLLENCFDESTKMMKQKLENIVEKIGDEILLQSLMYIKQVNDIPRLFRKTNKEIPSKACPYVEQILEPCKRFYKQHSENFDQPALKAFLRKLFSKLSSQYYSLIDDVLTSVQKTEESLRRLKNLREKSLTSSSSSERLGMSDDDKIRLQLYVDVMHWTKEITELGVERNDVLQLNELISLLEDATKIRSMDRK